MRLSAAGATVSDAEHAQIRLAVRDNGWALFNRRLWQRNYYEHVIRSDRALQHIRTYIESNPLLWGSDQLHPNNPSKWWREDSRGGAAPLMTTPAAAIAPADPG